ncbi:MAG: DNA mismatch repair protein MutL [Flavobacteriales bacterium]|nr:DNA mismatch repair protein MutL [Flavobacteriales bacterium]
MDIIQLLPSHVANQIAAGEVIQRPASAVKEMLENALDAGSSEIKIFVKDAGRSLLQIVDNGCGMSTKDAKMCFKRHATSKIKNADDLFNIKTMGFRGEAMASIGAIAHVEIKTKLTSKELGTHLIIEGGKIKDSNDCGTADGTSIKVKNLFYNVPARRKFLKSDKVEMRHINEEFIRVALANPNIKMQLFHNEKEVFHLPKSNFRQRIVNIIGGKKNESLVPVKEETTLVEVSGFVGKPESAKRTRGEQYFFVNGRYIKSHYLHHAVNKAFEELIPNNYFPSYFINLVIDPQLIDINIHPTKTEIKFEDEKAIYAIIRASVKRSLGAYNIAPSIDFAQELSFNIDYTKNTTNNLKQPEIKIDPNYTPFKTEAKEQIETHEIIKEEKLKQSSFSKIIDSERELEDINQIGNCFIAVPNKEGLLLMHQRRAHKRILFEYFRKTISANKGQSQKLLFPKEIKFSTLDLITISEMKEELSRVGFNINIEKDSIIITGVPSECMQENLQSIIENLIEQEKNSESLETNHNQNLALSLAKSLAIKKVKALDKKEIMSLKNELFKCEFPSVCPNGKRTMIQLKTSEIEKYF